MSNKHTPLAGMGSLRRPMTVPLATGLDKAKLLPFTLALVSGALLAYQVLTFWPFTVDDAYITFRYSANLAGGHGPTYNAGLAPVEGYTSFAWVLLMAVPSALGWDVTFFAKAAGVLATIGYIAPAVRFTYLSDHVLRLGKWRHLPAAIFVFMFAALQATAVHAVSGMETAFFTALLTLFLYTGASLAARPTQGKAAALALVALLVGLTRPEGNIAVAAGLVAAGFILPRSHSLVLAGWVALGYLLPGGIYFLWRYSYYGQLLPLPFYVKVSSQGLLSGLPDVLSFARHVVLPISVLLVVGLARLRIKFLPAVVSGASLLLFFAFPAHIMGYDYRYLFPVVPIIFIISTIGIAAALSGMGPLRQEAARGFDFYVIAATAVVCLVVGVSFLAGFGANRQYKLDYASGLRAAHIALGEKLRAFPHDKSSPILAMGDAGATPYYSGWRTIDTFGLNDAEIALSGRHDPRRVLSRNPDLVVLISYRGDTFEPHLDWEQDLYEASQQRGYTVIRTLRFAEGYYLWLMTSDRSKLAEYLQSWK